MADATVVDASVAINVLGCGEAETVLRALPGRIIVPDITSREVFRDPLHPDRHTDPLAPFVQSGLIERIPLDGTALDTFMRLVGADAPDDLGDGESASIALADNFGASIAVDETKGRRILREQFPHLHVISSVAVFASAEVTSVLGERLADVVFAALVNSRMRVLPEDEPWVLALLGERAARCPSLRRRRR